jgi:hypothetical protein
MGAASEVVCYTATPVAYHEMDPDHYTPVCAELLQGNSKNVKRSTVKQCLIYEHINIIKAMRL